MFLEEHGSVKHIVNPIRHATDNSLFIYAIHNHIYTKWLDLKLLIINLKELMEEQKMIFSYQFSLCNFNLCSSPSNLRNINNSKYNIRIL